ncbi:MAG: sulfotransferase [Gammaproteobacteria bacterium]|nr:sulfotransferase [Gammaproteobacteria bacterium]
MVAQIDREYRSFGLPKVVRRLASYALFEGRPHTTKGQWFNPVVFGLLRTLAAFPGNPQPKAPIFLIGLGRSGTTILGLILSLHRHVGFLNEPKAMWTVIDPAHDVTGDYSQGPAWFRLVPETISEKERLAAQRLYSRYARAVAASRVLDKYPELVFRIDYVLSLFPDARFILITRNGADACRSISTWSDRKGVADGNETEDWWGRNDCKWRYLWDELVRGDPELAPLHGLNPTDLDQVNRAATEWIVTMREGLAAVERYPKQVHHIRYEDLVAAPEAELAKLFHHCQLNPDADVLTYATKVLYTKVPAPKPELIPELIPLFDDMSSKLGYIDDGSAKP